MGYKLYPLSSAEEGYYIISISHQDQGYHIYIHIYIHIICFLKYLKNIFWSANGVWNPVIFMLFSRWRRVPNYKYLEYMDQLGWICRKNCFRFQFLQKKLRFSQKSLRFCQNSDQNRDMVESVKDIDMDMIFLPNEILYHISYLKISTDIISYHISLFEILYPIWYEKDMKRYISLQSLWVGIV